MAVIHDLTERKHADEVFQIRLKLFELSSSCSLGELMQRALDEISPVVNSPIGFYHFVEADQKTLSLQAWSTRTLAEFCKAEGSGLHYPIDQAGVWTDCIIERRPVIHNDYPALPHRKGLPPGHADVIRELVVPILRNGQVVSILGVGNKPTNYDEKDAQFVLYLADVIWEIVEHKRAEDKLQQLSRAVEQSPASIVITDTAGKIEYVNPRFTEVTGYSAGEAIGKNPRILKTSKTPRETHLELWQALTSGREWKGEFVNRKKNGEEYYEHASISPIMNDQGIITHYLAVKEDITERKMAEKELRNKNQILQFQLETIEKLQAELREQAIRDPLTGLYNRRYLYETMGRELARARREKYPISFMMMDIDHFKQFNDTYGHDAGDLVLVALAELLRTHTRQGDIACRYGGEEFLVIMPQVGEADARRRAEEIRHSFHTTEVDYGGIRLSTAISIGVAFYPRDGGDSDAVIKAADTAMYMAKQAGRNCVRVWEAKPQS
jgi:diguanylate cyclase (GGDEF)-like protein/PAS domain S-box-containing protein